MPPKEISLLVIEDEEAVLESYVDMFSVIGFEPDTAVD